MHYFTTSAQIAKDLNVDHGLVNEVASNLNLSDEFMIANIVPFDIPIPGSEETVTLTQLTEPGYNAVILAIPLTDVSEEVQTKLRRFQEQLYMNKSPALNAPDVTPLSQGASPQSMPSSGRVQIDESLRRKAEEIINSGSHDMLMAGSFADVHRKLTEELGGDPGYQNVRSYVIVRRGQIGIAK